MNLQANISLEINFSESNMFIYRPVWCVLVLENFYELCMIKSNSKFFFTKRIKTHSTYLHFIQIIGLFTLYMDFRIGKKSFLGKIYLNSSTPANY